MSTLHRGVLAAAVAVSLAGLPCLAEAAPMLARSVTHTAAIPSGYVGTIDTADLTDFDTSIILPQISPAGGAQITAITVTLAGGVFGDYFATNPTTNRSYSNQVAQVSARITVTAPDPAGTALGVVLPLVSRTFSLAPRQTVSEDGLASFASTVTRTDATSSGFDAIAALFLGTGTVTLPVFAEGTSRFVGSGNIRFGADTLAGAMATVTIDYLINAPPPPIEIPGPSGLALFGVGLLGLGLRPRR